MSGFGASRATRRAWVAGFWIAVVLCAPLLATAEDRVTVDGDTLRGRVADVTADGVEFEPAYGSGTISIPWEDVEGLESEEPLTVMHGDDGESVGRIVGFRDGRLLIASGDGSSESIEADALFHAYPADFGASVMDRLRSRFRYWAAALDAGAAYTDSTTDRASGYAALRITREHGRTRLLIEGDARYTNEKEQGERRSITENRIFGFTRGELDVTDRLYAYLSTRATHDSVQNLALRLEPRGGGGLHLVKSHDFNFSTDVGLAWIYEDYYGDEFINGNSGPERRRGNDNHWAVAFGAQADAKLPYGTLWRARAEYLPAVDDWKDDYIARFETAVDFPLLEWLSFTVALRDEYDNTPADGNERNTLTTTGALSFRFNP
jgi:hypothetical protein